MNYEIVLDMLNDFNRIDDPWMMSKRWRCDQFVKYVSPSHHKTPLHIAVTYAHKYRPALIRALIQLGISVKALTNTGKSALELLLKTTFTEHIKAFLEIDSKAIREDIERLIGKYPTSTLENISYHVSILKVHLATQPKDDLISICSWPSVLWGNDSPEIHFKSQNGNEIIQYLSQHPDIPVNQCDSLGNTALMHIVRWKTGSRLEIMRHLLDRGADPNLKNHSGERAVDFIIDELSENKNPIAELKLLIQNKASLSGCLHSILGIKDYDLRDKLVTIIAEADKSYLNEKLNGTGMRPLETFLYSLSSIITNILKPCSTIDLLIKLGAQGSHLMHYAIYIVKHEVRRAVINTLLANHIDINELTRNQTPIMDLISFNPAEGLHETFELLVAAGADTSGIDVAGELLTRITIEKIKIYHSMLRSGVDPNRRTTRYPIQAVTDILATNNNVEIEHIMTTALFPELLERGVDIKNVGVVPLLVTLASKHPQFPEQRHLMISKLLHKLTNEISQEDISHAISAFLAAHHSYLKCFKRTNVTWYCQTLGELLRYVLNPNILNQLPGSEASILGYMSLMYRTDPKIFHQMIHHMLQAGADPNRGSVLPLVSLTRQHNRSFCMEPISDIKTVNLTIKTLINYGANPDSCDGDGHSFWNYVSPKIHACTELAHQIYSDRKIFRFILEKIRKVYHPIMYHPDRLRTRIHNAQNRLDEKYYQEWQLNDQGWLEYLGIYDLESFQSKMKEYAKFWD